MKTSVIMSIVCIYTSVISADELQQAKAVIEVWLWGGPSQLESFDPKPNAPEKFNKDLKSIPTNVAGIEISELLPKLAQCADKYSLIRTLNHPYPGHESATYLMRTGRKPGGIVYPPIGTVVSMIKGQNSTSDIPPYVILTRANGRFSETGFLGEEYAPLVTGGDPNAARFSVDCIVAPGELSEAMIDRRFLLMNELNTFGKTSLSNIPVLETFRKSGVEAKSVIHGDAASVFDLSLESKEMRERYGRNTFGQSCLAARRLIEAGISYVMINAEGWDTHKQHFEAVRKKSDEFDQGLSALLEDLSEKRLLDNTIVWCTGEFGRTPLIQYGAPWNGGRGHFPSCFSVLVAGGGFKGGMVIGVSDSTASTPVSRPVAPQDLLGSIYERLGINPDGEMPNKAGVKTTILPPESKDGRLRELYNDGALQ